ncbi:putative serine/threonine protein kinase [Trichodelitschia bisporula]|uniref:Putative serine/threonine protein kinase n=1 Tax=Trichodelitschia bisporula TaxID=703511 RepID=A0A6G1IBG8_9PEZI|nr:putative serine/threonine protein kinase [Trichodelitschia bisporula]
MAASPLNPAAASPNRQKSNGKLKALTVQPKQSEVRSDDEGDSNDDAPVNLAEKLNNEEKRKYVKGKKLGEGTYAIVYKGHLRTDPTQLFAIKKIKLNAEYKDGLSMDAIREVKFLQELSHPNIIPLHSVFSTRDQNLNLVLEFLPLGDLEVLIRDPDVNYSIADIKAWVGMLTRAVWFCHANGVLHRDIKPNNLLIAADGEVKLADFGLARAFADPQQNMTYNVITRWYRPPELFFKARHYSGAVDMWSVGTVFAELILRMPFMAGNTDIHQLELICQAIGTPLEDNWPGVSELEGYLPFDKDKITPVRTRADYMSTFPTIGSVGVELLMSMLVLDPQKRATAKEVLEHRWWAEQPRPTEKERLPRKAGGEQRMGEDLKRRGGEVEEDGRRGDKVAKKLDFSSLR